MAPLRVGILTLGGPLGGAGASHQELPCGGTLSSVSGPERRKLGARLLAPRSASAGAPPGGGGETTRAHTAPLLSPLTPAASRGPQTLLLCPFPQKKWDQSVHFPKGNLLRSTYQLSSVFQLYPTLCNLMGCRLPCPSPNPGVHSNLCPLSQ